MSTPTPTPSISRRNCVRYDSLDPLLRQCSTKLIVDYIRLDRSASLGLPALPYIEKQRVENNTSLLSLLPLQALTYLSRFCFEVVTATVIVMPQPSREALQFAAQTRMLASLLGQFTPRLTVDFDVLDASVWSTTYPPLAPSSPETAALWTLEMDASALLPSLNANAAAAAPGSPGGRLRTGGMPFGSPLHPVASEDRDGGSSTTAAVTTPFRSVFEPMPMTLASPSPSIDDMLSAMTSYDEDSAFLL